MSGIFDQIINYSPPLIVSGTVNYDGTWDASTNTPTLNNPPAGSTKGDYYVVSVAGTQFSLTFAVGDWIISNGTAWEKVDLTDAVSSVFGRTGAVVGVSTDYSSVGLTNTAIGASSPSTGAFTTVTASSTIAATGAVTGSNLSGTNTGDQTITLTGGVTGSGTGSFAATVVTNANLTGAITSVGNATSLGSFSSANLASALTDETGSGANVFATSPTLVTPNLGTPSAVVLTNASGTASININGTVGATTAAAATVTSLTATNSDRVIFNGTTASGNNGKLKLQVSDFDYGAGISMYYKSVSPNASARAWQIAPNFIANGNLDFVVSSSNSTEPTSTAAATITSTGLNSTAIGATTASTGAFTTLSATGTVTLGGASSLINFQNTGVTKGQIENYSGDMFYQTQDAGKNHIFRTDSGSVRATISSTGLAVTGALSATTPDATQTFRVKGASGMLRAAGYIDAANGTALYALNAAENAYIPLTVNASNIYLGIAGTSIGTITSTGLAVTGTLSATSTITATGSIFTGTTAEITPTSGTQDGMSLNSAGLLTISRNGAGAMQVRRRGSDGNLQVYFRDTTSVGSIQVTTTGTTFTTTSDYRLKNITGSLTDSGTFIDALKPKTGTWKLNNSKFAGFLAHEFAEISPSSVAGEKDAVDADGQPAYQSMQASSPEVIANLVAELQSLRKRLAALESK
jgi:hypothetical protein